MNKGDYNCSTIKKIVNSEVKICIFNEYKN